MLSSFSKTFFGAGHVSGAVPWPLLFPFPPGGLSAPTTDFAPVVTRIEILGVAFGFEDEPRGRPGLVGLWLDGKFDGPVGLRLSDPPN